MTRKEFIEAHGATCANWQWSWSFVNEDERFVIFGAWDKDTDGGTSLILAESWERSTKGRRNAGYRQSREHIRLVEEEGYALKTFPLLYSNERRDEHGRGPAKIKGFVPEMTTKVLRRVGSEWYADDPALSAEVHFPMLTEEVENPESYTEGAARTVTVNAYERNSQARAACIEYYGATCVGCGFDFGAAYGELAEGFIHVHHLVPLSEIRAEYEVDPIRDLRPVCPNCHAVIHLKRPALTIEQLKGCLQQTRNPQ